uniref:Uncharacterized protein n=1 Tax=viral metagenome TaxID=1070528 RepID=A0A6C0I5T7_9ZZZZ
MPRMSKKYCTTTSPSKMGFSQKSSCKAQGYLKRTSKRNKGKYVISPKYKSKKSKRSKQSKISKRSKQSKKRGIHPGKINNSLYSNGKNKPRIKSGYGSAEIARETLKNIKGHSCSYKMQIVNTMYNRAKHHKYQTSGMKKAMKVFKNWLSKNK